jgi:hypothetical protein
MGSAVMEPVISGPLERLGVAAILVVAAYYLIKYFMSELSKKDTRNTELTDRFIAAMTQQTGLVTKAITDNTSAMNELKEAVRGLTSPVVGPRASDTIASRRHQ